MPGSPGRVGEGLPSLTPSLPFWPHLQALCISLPLSLPPSLSVCGLSVSLSVCLSLTHSQPTAPATSPCCSPCLALFQLRPLVMLTPQPESPSSSTQGIPTPPQGAQPSPHIFPGPLHPRSGAEFTTPSPVHPQNWSVFHTGSRGSCLQPRPRAHGSPSCPDIWLHLGAHSPAPPGPASASIPRPIPRLPHKAARPSCGKVGRSAPHCLTSLCSLTGTSPSLSIPLPVFSTRQRTPLIHSLRCANPSPSLEVTSPVRTELPASPTAREHSPPRPSFRAVHHILFSSPAWGPWRSGSPPHLSLFPGGALHLAALLRMLVEVLKRAIPCDSPALAPGGL